MNVNVLLKRSQNEEKPLRFVIQNRKRKSSMMKLSSLKPLVKAGLVKLLQPSKEGKIYKTLAKVEAEINHLVSQSVVTEEVKN